VRPVPCEADRIECERVVAARVLEPPTHRSGRRRFRASRRTATRPGRAACRLQRARQRPLGGAAVEAEQRDERSRAAAQGERPAQPALPDGAGEARVGDGSSEDDVLRKAGQAEAQALAPEGACPGRARPSRPGSARARRSQLVTSTPEARTSRPARRRRGHLGRRPSARATPAAHFRSCSARAMPSSIRMVVPVVAPVRVRLLDLAIGDEPLGGVGAELLHVLAQDAGRCQAAHEQLEVEALCRARLDRLEPGGERPPPTAP
jgi:hypothetical protein